jgi:hypothetical protein
MFRTKVPFSLENFPFISTQSMFSSYVNNIQKLKNLYGRMIGKFHTRAGLWPVSITEGAQTRWLGIVETGKKANHTIYSE